jgi:hypothetical protein
MFSIHYLAIVLMVSITSNGQLHIKSTLPVNHEHLDLVADLTFFLIGKTQEGLLQIRSIVLHVLLLDRHNHANHGSDRHCVAITTVTCQMFILVVKKKGVGGAFYFD